MDSLREELEEAESKVEQCRDQLAAEMFQLMSRETELAQTIIQYVKLQRAYHESALHCLADLIPGLESYISKLNTQNLRILRTLNKSCNFESFQLILLRYSKSLPL